MAEHIQDHSESITTEVLIVGAGPVGLATAIELGQRGIHCLVVEQQERGGRSPRAKTANVRTLEHFRRWGIADKLREASPLPKEYKQDVIFATRLNGHVLAHFENVNYCEPCRNDLFSEHAQWIPQYAVERVLRKHIATLETVRFVFGCRLDSAEQASTHVDAVVIDLASKQQRTVRCKYLVGADGARTTIRNNVLKIPMCGDHAYDWNYTIVFRAKGLTRQITVGQAIMYWLVNADAPCICGPMDKNDLWFFMATSVDKKQSLPDDPKEVIHRSMGLDFDIEIESVEPWAVHKLIAERYHEGRIFLAGDACHLHPPTGGYGMNMGIGDAVDLGWKLAAVLRGWGGENLLASYQDERKPIHEHVINQAVENYSLLANQLIRDQLEQEGPCADRVRASLREKIVAGKKPEFYTLGVILGDGYRDSPVICYGSLTETPVLNGGIEYIPSSFPGSLAPHLWLSDGSSLYDHFGTGLTLLCTATPDATSMDRIQSLATSRNIPITVIRPDHDRLTDLYETTYTLIRPDQYIAWRGNTLGPAIERIIVKSLGF
jgi:2-polyprenyl-6-methoxyphenol hydroxylase-like FAD-dependent oxidoreductase